MIVLDPDLFAPDAAEPSAHAPRASRVSRKGAVSQTASLRKDHLPSPRTLSRFLAAAQSAARLRGQVTVMLTSDESIRRLNRRFRGKNKATDVLSFPAEGLAASGIAGDLAISVQTALRQAEVQKHALLVEIKILILHGLLHLAGYDHETDDGQMLRRERLLRGRLKLPQGLIERTTAPRKPVRTKAAPARKATVGPSANRSSREARS